MMRLATTAGSISSAVRTPVVACHQEWSGKSPLSEALTEARSDQQILIQHVPVDAHVIHKFGDISALPGEDCLGDTDSHARALMCSREPKAEPSAVVPASGVRTSTVSCTYGVSQP